MGQSCGGVETYRVAADPRITTTVLWNSGLLSDGDNHLPQRLPAGLPAFTGNLDVGHYGAQFVGPACGLCATEWDVLRKNLG